MPTLLYSIYVCLTLLWKISDCSQISYIFFSLEALAHPVNYPDVVSESRPQELALFVDSEPVHVEDLWHLIWVQTLFCSCTAVTGYQQYTRQSQTCPLTEHRTHNNMGCLQGLWSKTRLQGFSPRWDRDLPKFSRDKWLWVYDQDRDIQDQGILRDLTYKHTMYVSRLMRVTSSIHWFIL